MNMTVSFSFLALSNRNLSAIVAPGYEGIVKAIRGCFFSMSKHLHLLTLCTIQCFYHLLPPLVLCFCFSCLISWSDIQKLTSGGGTVIQANTLMTLFVYLSTVFLPFHSLTYTTVWQSTYLRATNNFTVTRTYNRSWQTQTFELYHDTMQIPLDQCSDVHSATKRGTTIDSANAYLTLAGSSRCSRLPGVLYVDVLLGSMMWN